MYVYSLLIVLLGGASGLVTIKSKWIRFIVFQRQALISQSFLNICDTCAVLRVPTVATFNPWQFRLHRLDQVVNCPTDYRVVVHSNIQIYNADCIANS